ncbi:protein kinase [Comamonas piscis]|uniref:non-specific serine/threonine protein kinase n=1 Tax=Comamonas piscis TaxID=1562974 RepID=A0A7G5EIJ7_9BURK|nr:serine/threonine-protein kinase [Comamonas piscis]QMV73822.1 protein kinase [Comamonas piscis]WSO32245.1 protein kinase [Comamonas piscis]
MEQDNQNNAPSTGTAMGLAIGTRLHEFELLSVIGEGGFSIVYLAYDHSLQRTVAIKEYLPGTIAFRDGEGLIRPRFEKYEATFNTGRHSFLNEARILAQFEHPALIRIHRFWEQNGTAYMVMQYCAGKTLRKLLLDEPQRHSDEHWLKVQVMDPVLDALQLLHSRHYYHRDLSPDNIIVLDSGMPMLLDFGAARQVIGDMTQALTVILKPGFAPIEQYADDESMRQGPWTDIYGVGAVMYFAVTGKAPVASVARLVKDPLKKLSQTESISISAAFAHTIDHALAVFPNDRPQSIEELRRALLEHSGAADSGPRAAPAVRAGAQVPTAGPDAKTGVSPATALTAPAAQRSPLPTQASIDSLPAMPTTASPVPPQAQTAHAPPNAAASERSEARHPPVDSPRQRLPMPLIAGVVALLVALGAMLFWWIGSAPSASVQVASTSSESLTSVEPNDSTSHAWQTSSEQVDGTRDEPPIWSDAAPSDSAPAALDGSPLTAPGTPATFLTPFPIAASSDAHSSIAVADPGWQSPSPPARAEDLGSGQDSRPLAPTPTAPVAARVISPPVLPAAEELSGADQKEPGAYLRFSIQPWGRVLIDGQEKGISPPMTRIWLPEGRHQIVIENGDLQKHSASIHITHQQDAVLSHKF